MATTRKTPDVAAADTSSLAVLEAKTEALAAEVVRLQSDNARLEAEADHLRTQVSGLQETLTNNTGLVAPPTPAVPLRPFVHGGLRYRWNVSKFIVDGRVWTAEAAAENEAVLNLILKSYQGLYTPE
jgi:hypothetical protein